MPLTDAQKQYQREYYIKNRAKRIAASCERQNKLKAEKRIYDQKRRSLRGNELKVYDFHRSKTVSRRIAAMAQRAKQRAKKYNIPFSLLPSDIKIPEFCPILGIRLDWHDKQGGNSNSPSLDRIIPELGYIPSNVHVISKKANLIKTNATPDEIRKVATWLEFYLISKRQD